TSQRWMPLAGTPVILTSTILKSREVGRFQYFRTVCVTPVPIFLVAAKLTAQFWQESVIVIVDQKCVSLRAGPPVAAADGPWILLVYYWYTVILRRVWL